ncbi:uncharacterized protein J5F26_002659 [Ciconia maguari]
MNKASPPHSRSPNLSPKHLTPIMLLRPTSSTSTSQHLKYFKRQPSEVEGCITLARGCSQPQQLRAGATGGQHSFISPRRQPARAAPAPASDQNGVGQAASHRPPPAPGQNGTPPPTRAAAANYPSQGAPRRWTPLPAGNRPRRAPASLPAEARSVLGHVGRPSVPPSRRGGCSGAAYTAAAAPAPRLACARPRPHRPARGSKGQDSPRRHGEGTACREAACGFCPCSSTPCVGQGRRPAHSERFLKVAAEELVKQKRAVGCCMTRQEAETLFELLSNLFCNADQTCTPDPQSQKPDPRRPTGDQCSIQAWINFPHFVISNGMIKIILL